VASEPVDITDASLKIRYQNMMWWASLNGQKRCYEPRWRITPLVLIGLNVQAGINIDGDHSMGVG